MGRRLQGKLGTGVQSAIWPCARALLECSRAQPSRTPARRRRPQHGHQLSGMLPANLSALNTLVELDLSDNDFRGALPAAWLAPDTFQALEVADLHDNELAGKRRWPPSGTAAALASPPSAAGPRAACRATGCAQGTCNQTWTLPRRPPCAPRRPSDQGAHAAGQPAHPAGRQRDWRPAAQQPELAHAPGARPGGSRGWVGRRGAGLHSITQPRAAAAGAEPHQRLLLWQLGSCSAGAGLPPAGARSLRSPPRRART